MTGGNSEPGMLFASGRAEDVWTSGDEILCRSLYNIFMSVGKIPCRSLKAILGMTGDGDGRPEAVIDDPRGISRNGNKGFGND